MENTLENLFILKQIFYVIRFHQVIRIHHFNILSADYILEHVLDLAVDRDLELYYLIDVPMIEVREHVDKRMLELVFYQQCPVLLPDVLVQPKKLEKRYLLRIFFSEAQTIFQ